MFFATWKTAISNSSGGRTSFTSPQSQAFFAEKGLPVKMISFALLSPTARDRVCVPPAPGIIPIFVSVCANFAVSAA